jgi:nitroreductase
MNEYINNLNKRYATKQFDTEFKLSEEQANLLDESLVLTPSSFGLQPYKFIKVVTPELKVKLQAASWNQPQVASASVLYVLCARKDVNQEMVQKYIEQIVKVRGVAKESLSGYEQMMTGFVQGLNDDQKVEWAKKQVYIALGFLLDAAAQNGLDSCPMEGFDAKAYSEILGLDKTNLIPTLVCPVGMRSKEDTSANYPKVRLSTEDLILTK